MQSMNMSLHRPNKLNLCKKQQEIFCLGCIQVLELKQHYKNNVKIYEMLMSKLAFKIFALATETKKYESLYTFSEKLKRWIKIF